MALGQLELAGLRLGDMGRKSGTAKSPASNGGATTDTRRSQQDGTDPITLADGTQVLSGFMYSGRQVARAVNGAAVSLAPLWGEACTGVV